MDVGVDIQAEAPASGAGLAAADSRLEREKFLGLGLSRLLRTDDIADLVELIGEAKLVRGVQMLEDHVVVDGKVPGGLVGHVDVMPLVDKADERTSHRDDIVVRMGRENQHFLREGRALHGTGRIVGGGLASRPACDRVLELVEYIYVDLVERPVKVKQFSK